MSRIKKWTIGILLLLIVLFTFLFVPYYRFATKELSISLFKTLFAIHSFKTVDSQINILVLGIPGEPHDGPYLSDTILVMNYDFKKNRIITVNIPRDIWSASLEDKINTAYSYGEAKKKGAGLALARAEASSIVGSPIQYAVVMDFSGFKKLIDFLGGVDIEVERSFVDNKFPIAGRESDECPGGEDDESCRYQTVKFAKGMTHMNGETALKFVRSRNAIGAEGSDFARGRRQEKVLDAAKSKIFGILLSFQVDKVRELYKLLDKILVRNITDQDAAILGRNIFLGRNFYTKSFSLPSDLFIVPPVYEYGRYVLIPKEGFDSLHGYFSCITDKEDEKKCTL